MYLDSKQVTQLRRKAKSKIARIESLSKKKDWKTRGAEETFNRPAFYGTVLETKKNNSEIGGGEE